MFLTAGLLRPHARGVQKEDGREQRQKWAERQEEEEALLHPLMAKVAKAIGRKKFKRKKSNKYAKKQTTAGWSVGQSGGHVTLLHTNSPNTLSVDQLTGRTADVTISLPARFSVLRAFIFLIVFYSVIHTRKYIHVFFPPCLTSTYETIKLLDFLLPVCVFSLVISVLFRPWFRFLFTSRVRDV